MRKSSLPDWAKKLLLLSVSIALCTVAGELALRAFTPFPIHNPAFNIRNHDALERIMSQTLPDIDAHGFRNPPGLDRVDLVTLGDSHTYGFNVSADAAWPRQLAAASELSVYNYGVGTYGVLHYAYLFEKALERRPRYILVGLYPANDFADFCTLATRPYWTDTLDEMGLDSTACGPPERDAQRRPVSFRERLIASTAIASMLWYIKVERIRSVLPDYGGREHEFGNHTVFVADELLEVRAQKMDPDAAWMTEAKGAAFQTFTNMSKRASALGIAFGVLIIPSRERVLSEFVDARGAHEERLREVARMENELVQTFRAFFEEIGVPNVDAFPEVRDAFEDSWAGSDALYPFWDAHPLEPGYAAYARAASALVDELPRVP